jgi:hypothetical protein
MTDAAASVTDKGSGLGPGPFVVRAVVAGC